MVGEQRPSSSGHGTPGHSSRGRLLWLVLAVVGLLALVSVGSLRQAPGAGAGTRHFPSALVQTLGLLAAIAVVLGAVVFASTLLPGERVRRRRNPVFMPSMLLGFVLLLAVLRRLGWLEKLQFPSLRPQTSRTSLPTPTTPPSGRLPGSGPAWVPFVVVGALALALAVVMVVRGERARRRRAAVSGLGQLAELLGDTLADLEDETDPRRAVIAAWVRMERGLAAAGLPRHVAEAPLEYVARVLERANVQPASVRRLADLFERAKFSQHTVDEGMRAEAIEAVATIRRELEAEQARAEEQVRAEEEAGMAGSP